MNLLIALTLLLILFGFYLSQTSANARQRALVVKKSLAEADKAVAEARKRYIEASLRRLSIEVDSKLIERFPVLRERLRAVVEYIPLCYDVDIDRHNAVNIFEAEISQVIEKFFMAQNQLITELSPDYIHKRVEIFIQNLGKLGENLLNCVEDALQGKPVSKLGLTPLAFYSREEIQKNILNLRRSSITLKRKLGSGEFNDNDPAVFDPWSDYNTESELCTTANLGKEPLPESFSWQDQGFVSPVYNQGSCGSCYIFSTMSALESQYMIKYQTTVAPHFSVQAALNCLKTGCSGGQIADVAVYLEKHGAVNDSDAPYVGIQQECTPLPIAAKPRSHCNYADLSQEEMQRLLMKFGPASVVIDASSDPTFWDLKASPFFGNCSSQDYSHAVLLVGWTPEYWIIKNSWSKDWGIDGFLYLPREENKCAIQSLYSVPIM